MTILCIDEAEAADTSAKKQHKKRIAAAAAAAAASRGRLRRLQRWRQLTADIFIVALFSTVVLNVVGSIYYYCLLWPSSGFG